jgi:hypothetical protein
MVFTVSRRRSSAGTTMTLLAAAWLIGCGGSADTTDPDGHIRYAPPEGWKLVGSSNETRYRPADAPNLATIQVATIADDGTHDLEAEKRAWLEFQAQSGQEIRADRDWSDAHHRGYEYVHTVETNHGDGVWHHLLARGDGYRIAAHLQTTPGRYPDDRAVFERVVGSIRPVAP